MHPKLEETHALIDGLTVARIINEFQNEFRDVYPTSVHYGFCAVGPLQSLIGMAIKNGHLSASSGSAAPVAWQYELFWDRGPDDRRWMTWTSTDKPADSPKVRNVRPLYAAPALSASPLREEPS